MNIEPIDISKSVEKNKLFVKKSLFVKVSDLLLDIPFIIFIPLALGNALFNNITAEKAFSGILLVFILSLILSAFTIYSISELNSLQRIKGISRVKNSKLVIEIAETNKWKIKSNDQQMTIISFSWKETGTDWGKELTILYDKKDLLLNCKSYGLFSTPLPYHWFANRKKENKLKMEFNKRIKHALQHRA